MKKILLGLVLGIMLCITGASFAAGGINALKANFKVLVNGHELKSSKPIVTINGTTYLPLSEIGKALGVNVAWNSKLKRVEIGETKPDIEFTNIIIKKSSSFTTVEGEAKNNLLTDASFSFKVSFYDSNKKLLGTADGFMTGLKSGEIKTFEAIGSGDYSNYDSYKIQVDNIY